MKLHVELKLDQTRCIRGQSVFFTVTIRNDDLEDTAGIASLHPFNQALRLLARPQRGRSCTGWPDGFKRRENDAADLTHWDIEVMTLTSGQSVEVAGDLLNWIGTLPVGDCHLRAVYDPMHPTVRAPIQSAEVRLQVAAARPVLVEDARLPQVGFPCPQTTVWRHATKAEPQVFVSAASRRLPPNPAFGIEVQQVDPTAALHTAAVELAEPGTVHVVWADGGALSVIPVPTGKHSTATPWKLKAPVGDPLVLASPLTLASGELRALISDQQRSEAHLLRAHSAAKASFAAVRLGGHTPIGPYAVFWTAMDTLEFVWAAEKSRDIYHVSVDLEDPDETNGPNAIVAAPGSVLRIDAAAEQPAPQAKRQGLLIPREPEQVPEDEEDDADDVDDPEDRYVIYALCAQRTPRQLVVIRKTLPNGPERQVARFEIEDEVKGTLRAVDSVMTGAQRPAYLLVDEDDKHFFASFTGGKLQVVDELVGDAINAKMFPKLVAASKASEVRWIYLRYFSEDDGGFRYVKLEPADRGDPYKLLEEEVPALRWF